MSIVATSLAFLVKVEGSPFSAHRCPQGIYAVEVIAEKTLQHSACAASEVARDCVPFLQDRPDAYVVRVFTPEGDEIIVPRALPTHHAAKGIYCGRSRDYPESITLQ